MNRHVLGREPIEVKARFDEQGNITPLEFVWKGSRIVAASVGRSWETAGERHILTLDLQAQVYELIFVSAEGRWYLAPPKQPLSKA
ncbi:MAG: hypothetical protein B6D39_01970 [Anaerolineae bacterium UTCFX2]|jgi:hypothetical protein|nr:hypothetical protein [Anaerolineae bacterium]MCZ7552730.1 hypothetical protein [Anaerolineales bacterium]OQY94272.1 MAG: hypothetical protein B6D39_01970 [Anaerolineae bacterium UTCFX2]